MSRAPTTPRNPEQFRHPKHPMQSVQPRQPMQPTHRVHPRQAAHATENRVAAHKKVIRLPTVAMLPAVAIEPAVAMLPAVAIEPPTPMLPAVAIEPATPMLPAAAIDPATPMLSVAAIDPATPMLSAAGADAGEAAALGPKPSLSVVMGTTPPWSPGLRWRVVHLQIVLDTGSLKGASPARRQHREGGWCVDDYIQKRIGPGSRCQHHHFPSVRDGAFHADDTAPGKGYS
jgi:hypothetical protein